MTKFGLVKHSLIGLLLITLAGCCDRTDSFARLTDEEIEYIPFTDVEHVDFVDESGEVHTGTYSGRILEEFNLRAGDDEACNSMIEEFLSSDLEIPSKEQIFHIYVESCINVRSGLSKPASFRVVNGINFPVVERCGTRARKLNISDYETSYSFNDRVLEDVLVLGSCRSSSDAVIIYSGAVGIVLVEFSDGSYLMNKEVNDL